MEAQITTHELENALKVFVEETEVIKDAVKSGAEEVFKSQDYVEALKGINEALKKSPEYEEVVVDRLVNILAETTRV